MRYLIIFCVFLFPAAAFSQDECKDWKNGSQGQLNHCSYVEYQKQDRELNRVWKILWPKIKSRARALKDSSGSDEFDGKTWPGALLAGQRAWIKYRDNQCVAERFFWHGGSGAPMVNNSCLTELTIARTKQFKTMLNHLQ